MPVVNVGATAASTDTNYPIPPPKCVEFIPVRNNTRSLLQLSFTGPPCSGLILWKKQGYFALNFTSPTDRSLLEIPMELAKTVQKVNMEIPLIPNFPLFFWSLQLPLLLLSFAGLVMAGSKSIFAVLLMLSFVTPYFILRRFVGSLVKELRRLATKHSETYFLRVRVSPFIPFWSTGGGFFSRRDAFMVALGVGLTIQIVSELEYGAPTITSQSSRSKKLMSKRAIENSVMLQTIKKDNLRGDMQTQMQTGRNQDDAHNQTDLFAQFKKTATSEPDKATAKVTPVVGKEEEEGLQPRATGRATRVRGSLPTLDVKELVA